MLSLFIALQIVLARAEALFPVDYEASRARFRAGCEASRYLAQGFCRAFVIPSQRYRDLSVDVAYYGRGGSRLLVLESGTHGPEGYTGAAIQELARRRHLERLLDQGIDVLMIHAINPFGFRENRRVDEGNVNLNRNFLKDGESYAQGNPGYRRRRATFEPTGPVGSVPMAYAGVDSSLLWELTKQYGRNLPNKIKLVHAVRPVSEAMNTGQYEFERGINFGGTGPTPQVEILRGLLKPLLAEHAKTIFVDWHTGLGDEDVLHLMTAQSSTPTLVSELKGTFAALADAKIRTTIAADDPGFFRTTGGIDEFVPALAPEGHAVLALTAEFGTMGTDIFAQLRSAHRMIVENQAWFNGCRDALICGQVRRDFINLFNPPDGAWRNRVLSQADRFLDAVANAFR